MNSSVIALILILLALVLVIMLIAHFGKPRLNKNYFISHWENIEKETNAMSALVAADSLVDEALKRVGLKGGTMGERLNNAAGILRDVNAVWSAHKLRNRVVHEPGTQLTDTEAQRAMRQFKKALKDLGAI